MSGKRSGIYSQVKNLGILTTIPILLLVGPAVGIFIGNWIDRKAGTYPWFIIFFGFLGFAASAREMVFLLKQILKEDGKK